MRLKNDPSKYPLSHTLINIHDACSEFGSHADISSFFYRLERKKIPDTKQDKVFSALFSISSQSR